MKHLLALIACLLLGLTSCGESENMYCNIYARFVVDMVPSVIPLNTALNSMGEFCTIKVENNGYHFYGSKTDQLVPKTALAEYSGFYLGLSGFIVGLPSIPEMGYDVPRVICYDLACPNCYQEYNFTKQMKMLNGTTCQCPSCQRTYDLNNQGIVSKGEAGRSLFRYRISYVGNVMVIANK